MQRPLTLATQTRDTSVTQFIIEPPSTKNLSCRTSKAVHTVHHLFGDRALSTKPAGAKLPTRGGASNTCSLLPRDRALRSIFFCGGLPRGGYQTASLFNDFNGEIHAKQSKPD
jgi:hypothetical protein